LDFILIAVTLQEPENYLRYVPEYFNCQTGHFLLLLNF